MPLRFALQEILGSRAKVALLRALRSAKQGYSARMACRQAGIVLSTGQRALGELVDAGLVHVSYGGGAEHRYILNTDHFMTLPLAELFDAESRILNALVDDLRARLSDSGATVLLYGSVSRRDDKAGSDLDILVIGDPAQTERAITILYNEADWLQDRYGRRVSPLAMTLDEFLDAVEFQEEIHRDGKSICGPSLAERMRDAKHIPQVRGCRSVDPIPDGRGTIPEDSPGIARSGR